MRAPKDGSPGMWQERSFYEGHSFYEGPTWRSVREGIGHGLREHYEMSKELPPELLTLVTKLEDSDWLFRWRPEKRCRFVV